MFANSAIIVFGPLRVNLSSDSSSVLSVPAMTNIHKIKECGISFHFQSLSCFFKLI